MNEWKALHDFWFQKIEMTPAYFKERSAVWFGKYEAFDREVHDRFSPWLEGLTSEQITEWKATAQGYLSLVLLYDQVPRNSFRGQRNSARAVPQRKFGLLRTSLRDY